MQPHRRFIKYARIDKINELDTTAGKVLLPTPTSCLLLKPQPAIWFFLAIPEPRSFICHVQYLKTCLPDRQAVGEDKRTSPFPQVPWFGKGGGCNWIGYFRHVRLNANMITQLSGGKRKFFISLSRCLMMQTLTGSWGWQECQTWRYSDLNSLLKLFSLSISLWLTSHKLHHHNFQ